MSIDRTLCMHLFFLFLRVTYQLQAISVSVPIFVSISPPLLLEEKTKKIETISFCFCLPVLRSYMGR